MIMNRTLTSMAAATMLAAGVVAIPTPAAAEPPGYNCDLRDSKDANYNVKGKTDVGEHIWFRWCRDARKKPHRKPFIKVIQVAYQYSDTRCIEHLGTVRKVRFDFVASNPRPGRRAQHFDPPRVTVPCNNGGTFHRKIEDYGNSSPRMYLRKKNPYWDGVYNIDVRWGEDKFGRLGDTFHPTDLDGWRLVNDVFMGEPVVAP